MTRHGRRRERRRGGAPLGTRVPAIRVVEDTGAVFRDAIFAGVLSADRAAQTWAGHYLYMFHDEDGTAWFKHRDTRAYVSVSARQRASGCTR